MLPSSSAVRGCDAGADVPAGLRRLSADALAELAWVEDTAPRRGAAQHYSTFERTALRTRVLVQSGREVLAYVCEYDTSAAAAGSEAARLAVGTLIRCSRLAAFLGLPQLSDWPPDGRFLLNTLTRSPKGTLLRRRLLMVTPDALLAALHRQPLGKSLLGRGPGTRREYRVDVERQLEEARVAIAAQVAVLQLTTRLPKLQQEQGQPQRAVALLRTDLYGSQEGADAMCKRVGDAAVPAGGRWDGGARMAANQPFPSASAGCILQLSSAPRPCAPLPSRCASTSSA